MSIRFQLLTAGTIVFLCLLAGVATPPHTNTWEEAMTMRTICLVRGMWIIGGYAAFAVTVIGHGIFGDGSTDRMAERNEKRGAMPPH